MTIFFCPSLAGFWDDSFGAPPPGGVAITREQHDEMLAALNTGKIATVIDGELQISDPPPLVPTIELLKLYGAARRFILETAGITMSGIAVLTDRESQRLIADAASYVSTYGVASINFKAATGFVTLSAAEVAAIAKAVGAHVQASFSTEMALDLAIDAGTVTTMAEIDAWPWPSNS